MPTHFDRTSMNLLDWIVYTESSSLRSSIFRRSTLFTVFTLSLTIQLMPRECSLWSSSFDMTFVAKAYLSAVDMHITQFLLLRLCMWATTPSLCPYIFTSACSRRNTRPAITASRSRLQEISDSGDDGELLWVFYSKDNASFPSLYAHSSILPSAFGNVSISLTLFRYCIICLLLVRKSVWQFFPCNLCLFPRAATSQKRGDPQHIAGCFCCNRTCGYFTTIRSIISS